MSDEATALVTDMPRGRRGLLLSRGRRRARQIGAMFGQGLMLLVTSLSTLAVLFIFYFIARDAIPFFQINGFHEFFTSIRWYPSAEKPEFGAMAIFLGSALVTGGAVLFAVPLGVSAAVCLSDILPFSLRQAVKPVIEMLAAIPSVAYGFFALVVLTPLLQEKGGSVLCLAIWLTGTPTVLLGAIIAGDLSADKIREDRQKLARILFTGLFIAAGLAMLAGIGSQVMKINIVSGTNALNVSLILGIMALPTVVSVSEDALQAVGRDLREGSYALGATRAETLVKTVIPAAGGGIGAAIILGVMRAMGETMVVWMASGNSARIPTPWYNYLEPVRTLTATIAGDMGEADQVTGSSRYHVLFAMALCLLIISFACNMFSEWMVRRMQKKMGMQ